MKALRRSFLFSNFKENAILAKEFSFWLWLAFLQRDVTWDQMSTCYQYVYPEAFHIYY